MDRGIDWNRPDGVRLSFVCAQRSNMEQRLEFALVRVGRLGDREFMRDPQKKVGSESFGISGIEIGKRVQRGQKSISGEHEP